MEVPDRTAPSRPRGRPPGLTIHLLEGGACREPPVIRAFPGWRAAAIHEAMHEIEPSGWTHARLERLGRTLGARDGTGPDDDPLLRSLRDESRKEDRAEGREEGRREGRTEGRTEGRMEMVRRILLSRGVPVSAGFPGVATALAESPDEVLVAAALACDSEQDLHARIARIRGRGH